ncbi:hypothetical protein MIZ01_1756 [Sideroxyarcus emersonii]|uniref:TIR domain-containing protein n=1 Tax=Sideroxyarcus emersonii TaxID=2764705 RepID=A0AAN1XB75_9PROT|nr:DnaB-like helicase C-terminal domain-containing protein [Sideroxyarcus emersonii]BCK87959.1 hypothetical protein MIZ01_1756 [Sideroxyarcus emersonii]
MTPLSLFISYSHKDEEYLAELEKHLSTLKREELIDTWHDREIIPGQEWERKIEAALETADIYIFLISPDFVASEYCIEKEVASALERHTEGTAIVIPIVVRSVDWLSTPLGRIQALPKDATPIASSRDRDAAWLGVVKGIRAAITELKKEDRAHRAIHISNMSSALTSLVEKIEVRYGNELKVGGYSSGLSNLDQVIDGIHPGDLICISAAPVMDRLALLVRIMHEVFVNKHHAGLVVTLRKTQEEIARRLCAAIGGISVRAMQRGELLDEDWSKLTHALGLANDAEIGFIEQSSIDINELIRAIDEFAVRNDKCDLVIIDHFDNVTGGKKADLLTQLGRYARKNKIPIIVAMGLEVDPSVRPNKRPVLKDLGEWAVLNEDLDVVIFVYQDGQYFPDSIGKGLVELIVAKNSRGSLGTFEAIYSHESQTITSKIQRRLIKRE